PVVLSTLMKVPNGTASLGLITRSSPSSGAYASSSARLGSLAAVTTSPPGAIWPVRRSILTTRLPPSVTKSQGNAATTPLGPLQLAPPAAIQGGVGTTPADGGLTENCPVKPPVFGARAGA